MLLVALCLPCLGHAETASPLYARGYTVLPVPQRAKLENRDVRFGSDWRLSVGPGIPADDVAIQSLRDELEPRDRIVLAGPSCRSAKGALNLAVAPNSVAITNSADRAKDALAEQAYKLTVSADEVSITGNSLTGLFYGVQTFVQLLKPQSGAFGSLRARLKTGLTSNCA